MLPEILKNNLSVPVVGAPLFIISRPGLVIAQCKAGVVGSFPALNARPQEVLSDWIKEIKDELGQYKDCLLYTSPSPRDGLLSRMPSSA